MSRRLLRNKEDVFPDYTQVGVRGSSRTTVHHHATAGARPTGHVFCITGADERRRHVVDVGPAGHVEGRTAEREQCRGSSACGCTSPRCGRWRSPGPIYDVLRRNAEFFVAYRTDRRDILLFVAVMSFAAPLVLWAVVWLAGAAIEDGSRNGCSTVPRWTVRRDRSPHRHCNPCRRRRPCTSACRRVSGFSAPRSTDFRRFVRSRRGSRRPSSCFRSCFFSIVPSGRWCGRPTNERALAAAPRVPTPIVFVVFDQLPLTSLLAPDGTIDGRDLSGIRRARPHVHLVSECHDCRRADEPGRCRRSCPESTPEPASCRPPPITRTTCSRRSGRATRWPCSNRSPASARIRSARRVRRCATRRHLRRCSPTRASCSPTAWSHAVWPGRSRRSTRTGAGSPRHRAFSGSGANERDSDRRRIIDNFLEAIDVQRPGRRRCTFSTHFCRTSPTSTCRQVRGPV